VVYLYEQGFRRFSFGYASAVAWVLFLVIFAFTFFQFRRQREEMGG
jgi:multiple sugar transport system permease protein